MSYPTECAAGNGRRKGEKFMTTQTDSIRSLSATMTNERASSKASSVTRILTFVSSLDRVGMGLLRAGLVVVLLWIGGLKFASYEAGSIVPLVANRPVASFLYHHPAPEYNHYMDQEGEMKPANREWHRSN